MIKQIKHKLKNSDVKLPQLVQHKEGRNNGSFSLDQKFGKHETFQANKF